MLEYVNINGIGISVKFSNFLHYYKDQTYGIGYTFIKSILSPNDVDCYFNKIFKNITKIHCLENGYLLINDNQEMKMGRLLNKIAKSYLGSNYNEKQVNLNIENFIDLYKSWYDINKLIFKFLKGEDILYGYSYKNYTIDGHGMLHTSCMNNKFEYLDLYTKNPDKVNLLVLVDENNKIYGRSLVWKLDNKKHLFMDRVYGSNNYIVNMFNDYAIKNKMIYRSNEHSFRFKIYPPNTKKIYTRKYTLSLKLKTNGIEEFPYVDSLYNWDIWSGSFSNREKMFSKTYHLSSTYGKKESNGVRIFGIKIS